MKAPIALDDADRRPWLAAVGRWMDAWIASGVCGVITPSALKRTYRAHLCEGRAELRYVYLHGCAATLQARVAGRRGRFMPPSLMASQIANLKAPTPDERAIVVDFDRPAESRVEAILHAVAPHDLAVAEFRGKPPWR